MGTREITECSRTGTVAGVDARQRIVRSPVADTTAPSPAIVDVKRDQRGVAVTQCRDRLVDPNCPPRRALPAGREMTPLEAVLAIGSEATFENASEAAHAADARLGTGAAPIVRIPLVIGSDRDRVANGQNLLRRRHRGEEQGERGNDRG